MASVLGQLIPPSVPMILYGFITMTSVTACFLAGVGPGILTIVIYCTVNYFMVRNNANIYKPPAVSVKTQVKQVAKATRHGIFAISMPFILLGGIYGGIFTPTEAAAVALMVAIFVGLFIHRDLKFKQIGKVQNVPAGTVRGRYRRGLNKLRSILDGRLEK